MENREAAIFEAKKAISHIINSLWINHDVKVDLIGLSWIDISGDGEESSFIIRNGSYGVAFLAYIPSK